jgi:radical SAM superfamily enzyme
METFDFYLDQKHTIWYRNKFTIEANSLEEAKDKVIEICNTNIHDLPSDEWDLLHETVEQMEVGDNDGQPTEELYTHDGNMIWDNIKTN